MHDILMPKGDRLSTIFLTLERALRTKKRRACEGPQREL